VRFTHKINSIGKAMSQGDTFDYKADLKKRLSPIQYHVTQEKGTERCSSEIYYLMYKTYILLFYFRAFTGKYNKTTDAGFYTCVVCNEKLFTSETKFDSGCGWPAFNDVIDQNKVKLTTDTSNGMLRKFQ